MIEPWLTDQWFCNAAALAKPAIEAVESGRTRFVPRQWENTFFEWMRNIQPWCISRQLWWGHQIPAWYGPDGRVFVAEGEAEAAGEAAAHYGVAVALTREEDVLDTWFSSGLWPFSTLGWPEETPELKRYYPGDVLVTGFDIIFFWVARMMMQGLPRPAATSSSPKAGSRARATSRPSCGTPRATPKSMAARPSRASTRDNAGSPSIAGSPARPAIAPPRSVGVSRPPLTILANTRIGQCHR